MSKKKTISELTIITYYMNYVVKFKSKPTSVEEFSKINNFEPSIFYNYFSSFSALQKIIFKTLFDNSVDLLKSSKEFDDFDKKNKLIGLYFTFFENLTLNRDYVKYALHGFENQLKSFSVFSDFKHSFFTFIDEIGLDSYILNVDGLESFQKKTIKESAWLQLLFIMKFWLDDTSDSFEKTDIFIEKSINTSFDLLDTSFLKSFIDLGKFFYNEKIKPQL